MRFSFHARLSRIHRASYWHLSLLNNRSPSWTTWSRDCLPKRKLREHCSSLKQFLLKEDALTWRDRTQILLKSLLAFCARFHDRKNSASGESRSKYPLRLYLRLFSRFRAVPMAKSECLTVVSPGYVKNVSDHSATLEGRTHEPTCIPLAWSMMQSKMVWYYSIYVYKCEPFLIPMRK